VPDTAKFRRNSSLWLALIFAVAAVLCNLLFFLRSPAQSAIPWLSLALAVAALLFLALGVKNVFTQPRPIAAKIFASTLALIALVISAGAIAFFYGARAIPASAEAPQLGQVAPDFTLPNTTGAAVSLDTLFSPTPGAAAPKAVLLIFYRGYW
jgi:hypothetical protein